MLCSVLCQHNDVHFVEQREQAYAHIQDNIPKPRVSDKVTLKLDVLTAC